MFLVAPLLADRPKLAAYYRLDLWQKEVFISPNSLCYEPVNRPRLLVAQLKK